MNNGETRSRHVAIGRPRVIKKKEFVPPSKAKSKPDNGSSDITGASVSEDKFSGHCSIWSFPSNVDLC
ncbi:hypothetical protein TNCV_3535931 [Trichonephila clavipes]|uniref:Uncharacterized protein n=1 Tax=Trichonephila clavipes TaxID=2585209 RepID=A0A8X6VWP2_TRICX|nr:hypothetical protein TNCV_3535931 [Trichonephila clavipes]